MKGLFSKHLTDYFLIVSLAGVFIALILRGALIDGNTLAFETVGGCMLFWLLLSVRVVGPDEMAIYILFGQPARFCDSGPYFVPFFPACRLERRTKKKFNFSYPPKEFITKRGNYPKEGDSMHGTIKYTVYASVYLSFPRNREGLTKIIQNKIPEEDEELKQWVEGSVDSSLREAFGQLVWIESVEQANALCQKIEASFKNEHKPLIEAGFNRKDVALLVKIMDPPSEVSKALSMVETERLEQEAAGFEAKERAIKLAGGIIQFLSILTGTSVEVLQEEMRGNPKAFLEKHSDSWDKVWNALYRQMGIDAGAYFDFRSESNNPIIETIAFLKEYLPRWQMDNPSSGKSSGGVVYENFGTARYPNWKRKPTQ